LPKRTGLVSRPPLPPHRPSRAVQRSQRRGGARFQKLAPGDEALNAVATWSRAQDRKNGAAAQLQRGAPSQGGPVPEESVGGTSWPALCEGASFTSWARSASRVIRPPPVDAAQPGVVHGRRALLGPPALACPPSCAAAAQPSRGGVAAAEGATNPSRPHPRLGISIRGKRCRTHPPPRFPRLFRRPLPP
ncbi:hypothetical protein T484DRAFT_1876155, partial [Baffinella frigidus]